MKRFSVILIGIYILFLPLPFEAMAHHGGISLSHGPGSPIETNSPFTLPEGGFLSLYRVEHVDFRKFDFAEPVNKDSFTFHSLGLAYGIRPYLTGNFFLPYTIKRQDTLGSIEGVGDIRFCANLGFNYDPAYGLRLNKREDTAITLEGKRKVYLSLLGSFTLPTGNSNERLGSQIDRGMQPGFRSPLYSMGASAAKQVASSMTFVADTSYDIFTKSDNFKFGNEYRLNVAIVYEIYGSTQRMISKVDGVFEFNFLNLGRDEEEGKGLPATGGTILYLSPGLRISLPALWNANMGFLLKFPTIKNLNEEDIQQGSEGLEKIRGIATISLYF
ncbi:MAG: hypothetical protein HY578_05185 [Nitrospinae bacterium]|nr:hypothetical protein [Nitrospinota bacterium]